MKLTLLSLLFICINLNTYSQCSPDPIVMALGDPEGDGTLNPYFLEVHPGQEVDMTVTVLAPPEGEGEVIGVTVPYTMNYFIVKKLNNKPSWLEYDCPNNCRFDNGVYSCVHVTGTAPENVPIGDSTVMDVIVDANVDASVWGIPYNGYEVTDENGGTLTVRYVDEPSSIFADDQKAIYNYDIGSKRLQILETNGYQRMQVYNASGALLISSSEYQVNLNNQPRGLYIVSLIYNRNVYVHKIIVD